MLNVICFKWKPPPGYRSEFGPRAVNVLAHMVARHYRGPHKFHCVTDDDRGIDRSVGIIPLWSDFANVASPHGARNPSCYRRLRMFAPDAGELLGERFVSLDLDCVITGDVTPLWDRPEDFVIWGDTAKNTPYNGSMILHRAGTRPQLWTDFDPLRSPALGRRLGYIGSDQAWIGAKLGPREARWTKADGVYSYRNEVAPAGGALPKDARIVIFHGRVDPWDREGQSLPWVRQHWR